MCQRRRRKPKKAASVWQTCVTVYVMPTVKVKILSLRESMSEKKGEYKQIKINVETKKL